MSFRYRDTEREWRGFRYVSSGTGGGCPVRRSKEVPIGTLTWKVSTTRGNYDKSPPSLRPKR